jgi:hypothetical protein
MLGDQLACHECPTGPSESTPRIERMSARVTGYS